jgi:peptide/nickel transport system permease protein
MPYLIRRLASTVVMLVIVSVIVFSLMLVMPGDPVKFILGEAATAELEAQLRRDLGVDLPAHARYVRWLGDALRWNFGRSIRTQEHVTSEAWLHVGPSLEIGVLALAMSLSIGITLGCVAAYHRGSLWDSGATIGAVVGVCLPHFWLGMLLILFFGAQLGWFPVQGWVHWSDSPLGSLKTAFLPALTLSMSLTAETARMTRSAMVEVLGEDYIRTARAKGLTEFAVVMKHALRQALVITVTTVGLQIGRLVGGAVLTETIFSVPGVGRWVAEAVFFRDFLVVQFAVVMTALLVLFVNMLTDLMYAVVDPRTRYRLAG